MSVLVLFLVLLFGALAGAAAVWPFARWRARPTSAPGAWEPEATLGDGHRPPDLGALASQLLGLVKHSVQAQGVALLRRSEAGWKVVSASPGTPFTSAAALPFKEGLVGLAGEGDREILADAVHPEALGYLVSGPPTVSVALVPVHHRGDTLGILAAHRASGSAFQEGEVSVLKRCASLIVGWEASAAHVRRLESARLQEERVAAGLQRMLAETSPEELCGLLLDALFDILPAYYGFAVVSSSTLQYYCVVSKKFQTPDGFRLERDTWTHWVLTHPGETLYLEGTTSRETAMPILFRGEPFGADRVVLLQPMAAGGVRFGVVGLVGRASNPFLERDRQHASALLGQAVALLDLALLHLTQKNLAIRDALTGLFNRRHLDETLVVELKRAQRQGSTCAVILMDLDHFKAVNDTHGHEAGDTVLRAVAQRARESVREIDIVCRYGGEEFAVILPECDAGEAVRVAERIRRSVGEAPFQISDGLSLPVTVSLGVCAFPSPAPTLSGLTRSVDAALYEAKRKGRNRVVLAGR